MEQQNSTDHTPLMKQYHEIKEQYAHALVLFQVGDFYELFYDDAKQAAAVLGIALTARGKNKGEPIPLCGVPIHALTHYLHKLVKQGFNVVLCDQLENPRPGTIVKRGVTRVYTPGTLTDSALLDEKSPSYLLTFVPHQSQWALLFGELLTAQLFATTLPVGAERIVESELVRFFPDEIIVPASESGASSWLKKLGYSVTLVDGAIVQQQTDADQWLTQQFSAQPQIRGNEAMYQALCYFHAYMRKNQADVLAHFNQIQWYKPEDFLMLDAATQRNLELIQPAHEGNRAHTLFAVMDHAHTPMGSRMIKKWLQHPLLHKEAIEQRLGMVGYLATHSSCLRTLEQLCKQLGDLERIVGRIAIGRGHVHDYGALKRALVLFPAIKSQLANINQPLAALLVGYLYDFSALYQLLDAALPEDGAEHFLIKDGFDQTIDALRSTINAAQQRMLDLERAEQEATGISSLKIRYNQLYGYYIEITKTNAHLVPAHYIRQQTLVGRERYMTPALQQLQHEITNAQQQIADHEKKLFEQIKLQVASYTNQLRKSTYALAYLDALLGFAYSAYHYGYVRPTFNQDRAMRIVQGRHPVVERSTHGTFIPNDSILDDQQSLLIITGPNMGGKSTFLRQTALIPLMAQVGSFVPAQSADLPLFDRIFTRIGAGDNVAAGKSTFLVEMEETAIICKATKASLVILDEVGRGTSTYDGLAIAQAVVEYLYQQVGARCLFATHYHELTKLADQYPGIANYYAASKKTENGILLLYKMMRGVAHGSFGIEVAKIAQVPASVVQRAQQLLALLQKGEMLVEPARVMPSELSYENRQTKSDHPVITTLKELDYNQISPKQALDLLWRLKDLIDEN